MLMERFENYQISKESTLFFVKLLKKIRTKDLSKDPDLFKKYSHSLFSPFLYYLIEFKNQNANKEEVKNFVGTSKVYESKVLYAILNEKIYDLFFQRKKGYVYDEKVEINYDIESDDENYSLFRLEDEKELNLETLKKAAMKMIGDDEDEDKDKDKVKDKKNFEKEMLDESSMESLIEMYEFKRKEVISHFRYGYSLQERLITFLKEKDLNNQLEELPNIMFFQKNNRKKLFTEMDRIFLAKQDISFSNVKAYFKYTKNGMALIKDGEILKMGKNSLNFIEVKSSIMTISKEVGKDYNKDDKNNDKKDDKNRDKNDDKNNYKKSDKNYGKNYDKNYDQLSSNISNYSNKSGTPKKKSYHFNHLKEFISLFKNMNLNFEEINMIYIIDSFFPKNFFELTQKFTKKFFVDYKFELPFNLFFVQIESDLVFVQEKTISKQIKEEMNKNKEEMNNLKDKIAILQENMTRNEYEKEIKKIKKKMRKNINKDIIQNFEIHEIIDKLKIKNKGSNAIIGGYFNENFTTFEKFKEIQKEYQLILDIKTFIRYSPCENSSKILNIIKTKYSDNCAIYPFLKCSTLILLIDKIFFEFYLKELKNKLEEKNIIIKPILDKYFLVEITKKSDEISKFDFEIEIPLINGNINLDRCINLSNLLNYLYELGNIDLSKNLISFQIYDPYSDTDKYSISTFNNETIKEKKFLIILYNDLSDGVNKIIKDNEDKYNNILIIYGLYNSSIDEINSIGKYFFKNEKFDKIVANPPTYSKELLTENKTIFSIGDKRIIYDNINEKICYYYKIDIKDNKILLNKESIIDQMIYYLFDMNKNDENKIKDILIEETLSIISLYFSENNKNSRIELLEKGNDKQIIEHISKNIENNIIKVTEPNIIEYLPKNNPKYDLIIIENQIFPSEDNYLQKEKLYIIKDHLKEKGKVYFCLYLSNKYVINLVTSQLSEAFIVTQVIIVSPGQYLIECYREYNQNNQ